MPGDGISIGDKPVIREHDSVVLTCDVSDHGLTVGDVGTVVLVHGRRGFEVEFMTLAGATLAVVSLRADQVRPIGQREIAHARSLEPAA